MTTICTHPTIPPDTGISALDVLTTYQRAIALLVAEGLSNAEIGRRLHIAESTIRNHVTNIYRRLHIPMERDQAPRVRLARIVWVSQAAELVNELLEGRAA